MAASSLEQWNLKETYPWLSIDPILPSAHAGGVWGVAGARGLIEEKVRCRGRGGCGGMLGTSVWWGERLGEFRDSSLALSAHFHWSWAQEQGEHPAWLFLVRGSAVESLELKQAIQSVSGPQ